MTTGAEYEARIQTYDWKQLADLWSQIESGNTTGWAPGKALEYLIIRTFQLEGSDVTWPYSVRIDGEELEQIDGVIYTNGLACLVECKDTGERANIEPIAKLRNQLQRRPVTVIGSIFSRSGFTESATNLARFISPQTILLWGGDEINYAIQNQCIRMALVKKYRFCVERGLPDYNITVEGLL